MPLDELLTTIVTLRGRIEAHGNALRASEAQTRYALIDPLLRTLGWDTSDPAQVVPEYTLSTGRVDYALLADGSPVILLEAKSLGTRLGDVARNQAINYWWDEEIDHFAVTDGQRWGIYSTSQRGAPLVEFDVLQGSPAEVCLKALALWRQSVAEGHVRAGETPVISSAERGTEPRPATTTVPTPSPVSPPSTAEGWIPLTQQAPGGRGEHPPEIRFPDNSSARLRTWSSIGVEVARWVIEQGLIQRRQLPLQSPRGNYILATSHRHPPTNKRPDGRPFEAPAKFGRIYLESHGGPKAVLTKAKAIIQHAGLDPADFKVRLAD